MSVYQCPVAVSIIVSVVCIVCMDYTFLAFAHCQRLLVTMYGFRSGGSNGFFFHPSFSLIFLRHFHHPFHLANWFQLFACLIRAAIFHLTLAFVLICLSL